MYGDVEARKATPYLFVKSFLSHLQAVITGDRAKVITSALELLNKHPDLHNRNLANLGEVMDSCSAAFKQLQEWVGNIKGTANAKQAIDQKIAVLESQLESGLLPAKCRVPKEFTAMIERVSQYQMALGGIGSSNQTCATVFNDLV
jgi:hypothetical protein